MLGIEEDSGAKLISVEKEMLQWVCVVTWKDKSTE